MGFSTPALDSKSKADEAARKVRTIHPLRDGMAAGGVESRRDVRGISGSLRKNPMAYLAMVVLGIIVAGAILAPLLSPYDKEEIDLAAQYLPPSLEHPFGTDDLGRDIFVRTMYGGRVSLFVGFMAMAVALLVGMFLGGVAGYYGGMVDTVIMRGVDLMLAVPVFFVILFLSSALAPSIFAICMLIGTTQWMEVARLVRANVLSTRELEFVDAARVAGLPDYRILARHLLPHTVAPVMVAVTLGLAQAIIIESALSFLGFGVQPPMPSWGAMLQNAQGYLATCPWIAVFPGMMIFLTVVCCNILADFLGDVYSPTGTRAS